MKTFTQYYFTKALFFFIWIFLCSAISFPSNPIENKKFSKSLGLQQQKKVERLENRLKHSESEVKSAKIKDKIKKIKYGQQGDALGLAALISGILSILLSVAVLTFLGIDWQILVFVGLLLGAAAIIVGIVDLRYTDFPGQAFAAMIAGGLGIIAGIIALVIVK